MKTLEPIVGTSIKMSRGNKTATIELGMLGLNRFWVKIDNHDPKKEQQCHSFTNPLQARTLYFLTIGKLYVQGWR